MTYEIPIHDFSTVYDVLSDDRPYVLSLKVTRFQYYTASMHMTYASTDIGSFHCLNQSFAQTFAES